MKKRVVSMLLAALAATTVLTGCSDDGLRRRLIKQQILLSGVFSAIAVAAAFLGGFSML